MRPFPITPFIPVFEEEPFRDFCLDLARFDTSVLRLVAIVGSAFGIDLGSESDPLTVRRPNGISRSGGNPRDLLSIIAVRLHGPDLTACRVGDPFPIGRPARRAVRFIAGRD